MAKQEINLGTADKGNGDPLRVAFNKVNQNFTELYNHTSSGVSSGSTAPTSPGEGDLWWDAVSGRLYVYYGTSWVDASPVDGVGSGTDTGNIEFRNDSINDVNGIFITNASQTTAATASITIPSNDSGDSISITNEGDTWSFGNTGILTLPYSNYLETTDTNLKLGSQGSVTIRSNAESNLTDYEWIFDASGNLTVPDRITFSDGTWQSTAFIGHAYELRNSPTGNLYVTLDDSGTINTPLLFPVSFTAVLDVEHRTVGTGTYTGPAWEFNLEWSVAPNGEIGLMADNGPLPSLVVGYEDGQTFEFTEVDHGIPGYTLTIVLSNVVQAGPAGWTANLNFSQPPVYPATIQSLGAVKLAANDQSLTFGTNGTITYQGTESDLTFTNQIGMESALIWRGGLGAAINNMETHLVIATNHNDTAHTWEFGHNGSLTLPGGTDTITSNTNGLDLSVLGIDEETVLTVNLSRSGALTVPSAINFNFLGTNTGLINAQAEEIIIAGAPNKRVDIAPNDGLNGVFKFGTDGSLTLPNTGLIKDSIGRGYINVNTFGDAQSIVSLGSNAVDETVTSVIEIAPNYGIGLTSVRNVDITAGYDYATVKYNTWQDAEETWVLLRNDDAMMVAPDTRPWDGMPSYEAYDVLMNYNSTLPPGSPNEPNPNLAPTAKAASDAYDAWQVEQAAINVTVSAKDNTWTFGNNGQLTVPGAIRKDGGLYLNSGGTGVSSTVFVNGTAGSVILRTDNGTTLKSLTFDVDGKLTVDGELSIGGQAYTSSAIVWENGNGAVVNYNGVDNYFVIKAHDIGVGAKYWKFYDDGSTELPSGAGFGLGEPGQLKVNDSTTTSLDFRDTSGRGFYTNTDGFSIRGDSNSTWKFGTDNVITLPNGAVIKDTVFDAIAFGQDAGTTSQSQDAVAIGKLAGTNTQGYGAVAIGINSGNSNQASRGIAIGSSAGNTSQAQDSVAIGTSAGRTNQGAYSVSIGNSAGYNGQGNYTVAIGALAGYESQGDTSVAIGRLSGGTQSLGCVAIGVNSGHTSQGMKAIAIGAAAGYTSQGDASIAIGTVAGYTNQHANSIILNASGSELNSDGTSRFYVNPIRSDATPTNVLFYNTTSKEVTYGSNPKTEGTVPLGLGTNTISINLEVNATYTMWLRATVNNGVIAYNATVTITNANLPVIGQQQAYAYSGAGTLLDWVSLPTQIVGTTGIVTRSATIIGTPANEFTFFIQNDSGEEVDLHYGYTKI